MRVLLSAEEIRGRVLELGRAIDARYPDTARPLTLVVILRGAACFAADLMRAISRDVELEFVQASSYHGTSGGEVTIRSGLPEVTGKDVLVVEDIVERGMTLRAVLDALRSAGAASVACCALLRKPAASSVELPEIELVGFDLDSGFVVGYGMDLDARYRNWPDIWLVE